MDQAEAEDLTQETFLRFMENIASYQHIGKAKNYLYVIAGNLCKNYAKKWKAESVEQEILERELVSDGGIHRKEKRMDVEQALGRLAPELREVMLRLHFLYILSGILKCPCCGKSLYGNIAKAHSKDKHTRYYYYCKNTLGATGHMCTFRWNIEQTEINRMVAAVISAMTKDVQFKNAIREKIGNSVNTEDMEKELVVYRGQLKQALGVKARLEKQMDSLDISDPHYDRKIADLERRYDEQYGKIEEIETLIAEVQEQIQTIRREQISGDNIYQLLLAFDEIYESANEIERKEFMKAFIDRIDLYDEKQADGNWIKGITFNFPVPIKTKEGQPYSLEKEMTVETVVLMSRK